MKKQVKKTLRWFVTVICIIPLICACTSEDDVDIFVGKTWKLSNFFSANNKPATTESELQEILASNSSFYIRFDNTTAFYGRTKTQNFTGTWSVDLKKRTIQMKITNSGNPQDALSKRMIEAIEKTTSYKGDYNYLQLKEASPSSAYMQFWQLN